MNLQQILGMLESPNPNVRLSTARVLGMVTEIEALDPLATAFKQEQDQNVRQVMGWAGQRIVEAARNGYNILDEIFDVFHITEELMDSMGVDPDEARLLAEMERRLERDLHQMKNQATLSKVGWTIGTSVAGLALGGIGGLAMATTSSLMGAAKSLSFNTDEAPIPRQQRRIPAACPTDANLGVWLKRLETEVEPHHRRMIIREIVELNNPSAMPHLFNLSLAEANPALKDTAFEGGKMLYLKMRYWNLTQDGTIQAEFEKRRASAQQIHQAQKAEQKRALDPTSPDEAARILRQAQQRKRQSR